MRYYHNLYVDERLLPKIDKIKAKLEKGKIQRNKYLIVLTKNEKNHLEFFDSVLLKQKIIANEDLLIVGIADGYYGAFELVQNIVQDVLDQTGDVNIRKYMIEQQKEFEERDV